MPVKARIAAKKRIEKMMGDLPETIPDHIPVLPDPIVNLLKLDQTKKENREPYMEGRFEFDASTGDPYQIASWGTGGNDRRKDDANDDAHSMVKKYGLPLNGRAAYIAAMEGVSERTVYRYYKRFEKN